MRGRIKQMTTQTAENKRAQISEGDPVRRWRVEQLRKAGYPARAARTLGGCRNVDLHRAIDLIARGCSPAVATRILL